MPRSNAGGPQPGSGHPPGHNPERKAAQSLSARSESASVVYDASVPAGVITACKLRARGQSYTSIANRLGHDWETIKRWTDKHFDYVLAEIDAIVDPGNAVRHLQPAAIEAIEDSLDAKVDPAVRLTAARDVLDRRFGKPRIISESYSQAAVHVTIQATGFTPPTPEFRDSALYDIVTDAVDGEGS